ncbi:serine/threonine-protein kinase pim-3-like [Archocentrus centrarchus]|uniref:serine/threonine-protein kinase pim-3-like n=1 Tax=Archocentrus centrarchus TaxID=63155 RepID=UPI0011E9CF32|nr:serine/threonine-protein kinase pim-3-like [Archocentrus centrarchus]
MTPPQVHQPPYKTVGEHPSDSHVIEEKYVEDGTLGRGGFGSVYAGRRKIDNLPVAIKHIRKKKMHCHQVDFNGKTRIIPLEAFLMLKVGAGPATVGTCAAAAMLDWYELEREVLLVMEKPVPGVSLLNYMENNGGCLEEDAAKNITKQMVDAALMMHTKSIMHRDIKTENLLLETGSNDLRVRVIDFGCGCLVQEEPYSTFSGTASYAPPEFFKARMYEAGPTTVWQLGVLLYEMLHRAQHFNTLKFLCGELSFNTSMSQDCSNFLRHCLILDPQQRATLEQLQLDPWLQSHTVATTETPGEMPGF